MSRGKHRDSVACWISLLYDQPIDRIAISCRSSRRKAFKRCTRSCCPHSSLRPVRKHPIPSLGGNCDWALRPPAVLGMAGLFACCLCRCGTMWSRLNFAVRLSNEVVQLKPLIDVSFVVLANYISVVMGSTMLSGFSASARLLRHSKPFSSHCLLAQFATDSRRLPVKVKMPRFLALRRNVF